MRLHNFTGFSFLKKQSFCDLNKIQDGFDPSKKLSKFWVLSNLSKIRDGFISRKLVVENLV